MKTEEKTVAFMLFSVVMQFVYSLGKKQKQQQKKKKKKNRIWGLGSGEVQEQRDRRAKF